MAEPNQKVSMAPSYTNFFDKATELFNDHYLFNGITFGMRKRSNPVHYRVNCFYQKGLDPFIQYQLGLLTRKYGLSFNEIFDDDERKYVTTAAAFFEFGLEIGAEYVMNPMRRRPQHAAAFNLMYGNKFVNIASTLDIGPTQVDLKSGHSAIFQHKNFLTGYYLELNYALKKINAHCLLLGYKTDDIFMAAEFRHEPRYAIIGEGAARFIRKDQFAINYAICKKDLFYKNLNIGFQYFNATDGYEEKLYRLAAKYKWNDNINLRARFNNYLRLDLGFEQKFENYSIIFCVGADWKNVRSGSLKFGSKIEFN